MNIGHKIRPSKLTVEPFTVIALQRYTTATIKSELMSFLAHEMSYIHSILRGNRKAAVASAAKDGPGKSCNVYQGNYEGIQDTMLGTHYGDSSI